MFQTTVGDNLVCAAQKVRQPRTVSLTDSHHTTTPPRRGSQLGMPLAEGMRDAGAACCFHLFETIVRLFVYGFLT